MRKPKIIWKCGINFLPVGGDYKTTAAWRVIINDKEYAYGVNIFKHIKDISKDEKKFAEEILFREFNELVRQRNEKTD